MAGLTETEPARSRTGNGAILRLATAVGIAPEGLPVIAAVAGLGVAILLVVGVPFGFWSAGIVVLLAALAIAAFFRDPDRQPPASGTAIVSAADGKVTHVGDAPYSLGGTGEFHRQVSVFMSPLDVHVNRAPIAGEISSVVHTAGEFRAAFRDAASQHNERNLIMLTGGDGRCYAIVQVAGYLARRIVCRVRERQRVARGERVGLIMFGSRVDHLVPREYTITVKIGDRVRAGESIIGELR